MKNPPIPKKNRAKPGPKKKITKQEKEEEKVFGDKGTIIVNGLEIDIETITDS